MRMVAASPEVTARRCNSTVVMLLEFWHTTYLEKGLCDGCGGQPGGDGSVTLDFGVLVYIPGGKCV